MKNYSKKAIENFRQGYNCAQSVLLAFEDKIPFDKETILKLSSSFGAGMGRMREVCGAVSAMFMIAGLKKGYISANDNETKKQHYEFIQMLAKKFKESYGTIICRELLKLEDKTFSPTPEKRTDEYYKNRPCEKIIEQTAKIIEENILD